MTVKTEMAVRQLLALDAGVERERIDRAVRILNGMGPDLSRLMRVVRYRAAAAELGVCRRTFLELARQGAFVKVFGLGKKALGVTRASLDAYERGDFERRSLTRHADLAKTDVPTTRGIPRTAQSVFAKVGVGDGETQTNPRNGAAVAGATALPGGNESHMKPMTAVAVRGILSLDRTVRAEDVVRAMQVLDPAGNPGEGDWLPFDTVRELLGIANPTLQEMIRKGALVRAHRPPRARAVGVTVESYLAFSAAATGGTRALLALPVENALRLALSKDAEIGRAEAERFIALLDGGAMPRRTGRGTVPYGIVTRHLGISRRTLARYLQRGDLVGVKGTGRHALGVTRESLLRMVQGENAGAYIAI